MRDQDKPQWLVAALELIGFMEGEAGGKIFDDDEVWARFREAVREAQSSGS